MSKFLKNVDISWYKSELTKSIYNNVKYLKMDFVLEWLFNDPSFVSKLTNPLEKVWGKSLISNSTITNQWTTKVGEKLLEEILTVLNKTPTRIKYPIEGDNMKKLIPDFETDTALYENKTRSYTTKGSAGEKILGTPYKYAECKRLYNKPLYIVCMAYQEVEAEKDFNIFNPQIYEHKLQIKFWEKNFGIKYIKATDLLKEWKINVETKNNCDKGYYLRSCGR